MEPAVGSLWELWDAPTQGPGMNSRNHHMFSSISAWIVQGVGGVDAAAAGAACATAGDDVTDITLAAAPVLGVSRATTTLRSHCGETTLSYKRTGGIQCAVAPEGVSSSRPGVPHVDDVEVDCGPGGGVITSIDFASWGTPTGGCGDFATAATDDAGQDGCHAPASVASVQALCLGKAACRVPTHADWWADHGWDSSELGALHTSDEGVCRNRRDPRRLHVQAACSMPHGVVANVTVPVGVRASVSLPAYGASPASLHVSEAVSGATLFTSGGATAEVAAAAGVAGAAMATREAVDVTVTGGHFQLRLASSA